MPVCDSETVLGKQKYLAGNVVLHVHDYRHSTHGTRTTIKNLAAMLSLLGLSNLIKEFPGYGIALVPFVSPCLFRVTG
jgi:hypothetical protein